MNHIYAIKSTIKTDFHKYFGIGNNLWLKLKLNYAKFHLITILLYYLLMPFDNIWQKYVQLLSLLTFYAYDTHLFFLKHTLFSTYKGLVSETIWFP